MEIGEIGINYWAILRNEKVILESSRSDFFLFSFEIIRGTFWFFLLNTPRQEEGLVPTKGRADFFWKSIRE